MASTFESAPQATNSVIEQQLNLTRWNVRLVELGAAAVAWLAGALLYLLLVAVVDHWIMPLGMFGRFLALGIFLAGTAAFGALVLWPLLRREINPVYAAKTIEESVPSLKNSLVNFLLLRKDPTGVKEAVLSAVEQRAATDIASVPVDLAVDRSKVIRLGYVLLAIVSLFALYKIRSPKDPFQTMARVFAPWARIERPSRVVVSEIEPGDITVYHGRPVTIRCTALGLKNQETVRVVYSSLDGQTIEQVVAMTPSQVGTRFEAELPARLPGQTTSPGVRHDLVYRVIAGDYVSRDYRVKVVTAPTIVVEKVTYDFKSYTRKPQQVVTGQGDLQALEGTRVTLHARANQPLETGFLEFDPPADGKTNAPEKLPLTITGEEAQVSFVLQLKPDRQTPWRTTYQLRFTTSSGEKNDQPIVHRIDVMPDLAPEIEWLTPERFRVDVPWDGKQLLELRAIDPDFGLKGIKLTATRGEQKLFEKSLLSAVVPPPQANVKFDFLPAEWALEEGDEINLWGIAEDGRVAPLSETAEPNRAKTPTLTLKITAPQKPAGSSEAPKSNSKQPNNPQQPPRITPDQAPNKPEQKPNSPNDKPGDNSAEKPNDKPADKPNDQQNGNSKTDPSAEQQGKQAGSQKEEGGQSEQPMKGEQGQEGDQNNGKGSQSGGSGGNQQDSQGGNQDGGGSQSSSQKNQGNNGGKEQGNGNSADMGNDGNESGDATGAGQKGGKSGKAGNDQAGGGDPGDADSSSGAGRSGGNSSSESENSKPHDGEVFDKVLEQLKKNGKQPQAGNNGKPAGEQPAGDGSAENPGNNQPSKGAGDSQQGKSQPQNGKNNQQNNNQGKSSPEKANPTQPMNDGQTGRGNEAPRDPASGKNPPAAGNEKQNGKPGDNEASSGKENQPNGNAAEAGKPQPNNGGKPGEQGKPMGSRPDEIRPGDRPAGDQAPEKPSGQPNSNPPKKPGLEDKNLGPGGAQKPQPGEGGEPQAKPKNPGEQPPRESGSTGQPKDPGAGDNSQPGAGQNSKNPMGSGPSAQQPQQDKPKSTPADNSQTDQGEPSPPGQGKKKSDSQGGESGDRNGGGKQGSGQSAGQEGNDSAGSKSAADQGAGQANDPGRGEKGTKGGQQEKSNQKTGTAGNEPGNGSSSQENNNGQNNQGQSNEAGKGSPTDKQPNSESSGDGAGRGKKSQVVAGGSQNSGEGPATRPEGAVPDGDEANLNYAQQATDLVLDHLKDQEHNPDPALLKQLGWTKDDLSQFLRRWESLKQSAETPEAKRQLDDSLRSLGLRPPQGTKRNGTNPNDKIRDLQDSGSRTPPPNRYREQFDAFRKGVGRTTGK